MADDAALSLLLTNIGYSEPVPEPVKTNIALYLNSARERLPAMGVVLDETRPSMLQLLVVYAQYLYDHRGSDRDMPLSLRLAINDAKVEKFRRPAT